VWVATTSLGEQVVLDADHPIRAGVLERGENGAAYAVVRAVPASGEPFRAIEGRLTRAAWYRQKKPGLRSRPRTNTDNAKKSRDTDCKLGKG